MRALTPLALGDTGRSVADLHDALRELGLDAGVPEDERAAQRYGDKTHDAVEALQRREHWEIPEPGRFDQDSADRTNQLLVDSGVLQGAQGYVRGAARSTQGFGSWAWTSISLKAAPNLGETRTNSDSHYRLLAASTLLLALPKSRGLAGSLAKRRQRPSGCEPWRRRPEYLDAAPDNIAERQAIHPNGVVLLRRLHNEGRYDHAIRRSRHNPIRHHRCAKYHHRQSSLK